MLIINWVDILIIFVIIYSAIKGFLTGLALSLSSLFAFVIGLFIALNYQNELTDYLIVVWQLDDKIASIIGSNIKIMELISIGLAQKAIHIFSFLFLLIATNFVIKTIGYLLHSILDWGLLAPVNRIGGAFFGLIRGFLLVNIILVLIISLHLPLLEAIDQSYLGAKLCNTLIKFDLFFNK